MQGGRGMGPSSPGAQANPMAALKLTQEQRFKVQEIQQEQQPDAKRLRGEAAAVERRCGPRCSAMTFARAVEIAKQVGRLEEQLLPSRVAMQIEIIGVLTPDQREIRPGAEPVPARTGEWGQGGPHQNNLLPSCRERELSAEDRDRSARRGSD